MSATMEENSLIEWDYMSGTLLLHMSFTMSNIYPYHQWYYDYIMKNTPFNNSHIPSGSTVEGLSLVPTIDNINVDLPDVDVMFPTSGVYCGERGDVCENCFHFLLETKGVHPGYVLLEVPDGDPPEDPLALGTMLPNSDKIYLDSGKHQAALSGIVRKGELHGPAVTALVSIDAEGDLVYALAVSQWPIIAHEWLTRKRLSNWPAPAVLQLVANEGCHVVPISHPKSTTMGIEWRLSFSLAEVELSKHLSVTQKKCYLLFKALHKHAFKEPKGIVSYHLKMVFFWSVEEISQEFWNEQSMGQMLIFLLDKLLYYLIQRNLPSYFIPTNNLIDTIPIDTLNTIKRKVAMIRQSPLRSLLQRKHVEAFEGFRACDMFQPVIEHAENGKNVSCSLMTCFIHVFYNVSIQFVQRYLIGSVSLLDQLKPSDDYIDKQQEDLKKCQKDDQKQARMDSEKEYQEGDPKDKYGNQMDCSLKESKTSNNKEDQKNNTVTEEQKQMCLSSMDSAIDIMVYCSHLIHPMYHPAIHCENLLLSLLQLPPYNTSEYDDSVVRVCDRILNRFTDAPNRIMFLQEIVSRIPTID